MDGWKGIKNELPTEYTPVRILISGCMSSYGYMVGAGWEFSYPAHYKLLDIEKVTHWKTLPEQNYDSRILPPDGENSVGH